MKYNPNRDLPQFAREFKTLSPSKLADIVLNKRNKSIGADAITHWFKRHPEVYDELSKELVQGLPSAQEEVAASIFQNGQFEKVFSVAAWLTDMRSLTTLSDGYINQRLGLLKQVCLGQLQKRGFDFVKEGRWCLKHPDRLNFEDAKTFLALIREKKQDPNPFAGTLKAFLLSKGITEATKIKVGKPSGFGKYKRLFVKKETLNEMLEHIKEKDIQAYVIDRIMYEKAIRINALLNLQVQNCKEVGDRIVITVFEKGRRSKYPKGKEIDRVLKPETSAWLKNIIGDRKSGKVFTHDDAFMAVINMEAIKLYCSEIIEQYGHVNPSHFWRHMFGQHMLMKTNWNKPLVAELGNWTEQALTESYGAPPEWLVKEWHEKYGDFI